MLPLAKYLGYIPDVVDEAGPVFAIVFLHAVNSTQRTSSGKRPTLRRLTQSESGGVFRACSHRKTIICPKIATGTPISNGTTTP